MGCRLGGRPRACDMGGSPASPTVPQMTDVATNRCGEPMTRPRGNPGRRRGSATGPSLPQRPPSRRHGPLKLVEGEPALSVAHYPQPVATAAGEDGGEVQEAWVLQVVCYNVFPSAAPRRREDPLLCGECARPSRGHRAGGCTNQLGKCRAGNFPRPF